MWTPKRVLLLSAGMALFLAAYFVYAFFLGRLDGLPPLPQGLLAGPIGPDSPVFIGDSDIDKKLQQAFGTQCPQVKKRIKFEVRKKNLVITAGEASFKEPDGKVKLTDFSVALFKDHAESKFPEITTITSDFAFLTFEEPIRLMDMSKGKITDGEFLAAISSSSTTIALRRPMTIWKYWWTMSRCITKNAMPRSGPMDSSN